MMPGADLVSVVIPTRNRAGMLLQTLRTVLAQDVEVEAIVVDEGSTDGTAEAVEALGDHRVSIHRHEEPLGVQQARNAGATRAHGDILAFVDDDDLWSPDKLSRQVEALDEAGTTWAYGGALTFSAGPRLEVIERAPPPAETVAQLPFRNVVPGGGSNVIVTREAFDQVGGFDTQIHGEVADWDLWVRLSLQGPPAAVDAPLVAYRRHAGNMSRKVHSMVDAADTLDERYRELRGGEPLDWPDLYRWLSRAALLAGDRGAARRLLVASARRGDPGALARLARTLIPLGPRPPVSGEHELDRWSDRIRPRAVVPWPPGTEGWVRDALRERPIP